MSSDDTNLPSNSKSVNPMDISPLLKEIYPKPKKKKDRKKRFGRIARLMETKD